MSSVSEDIKPVDDGPVTFINVFEVPVEQIDTFIHQPPPENRASRSTSQKVRNHSVELIWALTRRPMAAALQNAQLRVRKAFVRSSCPFYRYHAVAVAVDQEGWRSYFAQAVREIGAQPAPPHLALAKRAERPARCRLVQETTSFIDEFVAHHPRVADDSTQPPAK